MGTSPLTTVETALRYLLAQQDKMLEERAHALLFIGEVYALNLNQAPLTDAEYQRDAYSVYSEDINAVLEEINLPFRSVYRGDHKAPLYNTSGVHEPEITTSAKRVLDNVYDVTSDLSTDFIVNMCRQIPGVENARLNQSIDVSPENSHMRRFLDRIASNQEPSQPTPFGGLVQLRDRVIE